MLNSGQVCTQLFKYLIHTFRSLYKRNKNYSCSPVISVGSTVRCILDLNAKGTFNLLFKTNKPFY